MVLGYIGIRAYELYEAWRIGQMSVSTVVTPLPTFDHPLRPHGGTLRCHASDLSGRLLQDEQRQELQRSQQQQQEQRVGGTTTRQVTYRGQPSFHAAATAPRL